MPEPLGGDRSTGERVMQLIEEVEKLTWEDVKDLDLESAKRGLSATNKALRLLEQREELKD